MVSYSVANGSEETNIVFIFRTNKETTILSTLCINAKEKSTHKTVPNQCMDKIGSLNTKACK